MFHNHLTEPILLFLLKREEILLIVCSSKYLCEAPIKLFDKEIISN